MQSVESRSDWLAIQTITVADYLGAPLNKVPQVVAKIRKIFQEETEKLTTAAYVNDSFTIGDFTDSTKLFYTALPKDLFALNSEQPRAKSAEKIPKAKVQKNQRKKALKLDSDSEDSFNDIVEKK